LKKYKVNINPGNIECEYSEGTLLVEILSEQGMHVNTPCGGRGFCGKCLIHVRGDVSEPSEKELEYLKKHQTMRLACQTRIYGDVSVTVKSETGKKDDYKGAVITCGYGFAVDIGTTGIQVSIVDLETGNSYIADSFLNPQRRFGDDVISRISASADPEVYKRISGYLRKEIFSSITAAIHHLNLKSQKLESIVFSGNTTMMYFLFGLDVVPLGIYPYHASFLDYENFSVSDTGFDLSGMSDIYALPSVSSFLGGDLTGGLAIVEDQEKDKNIFFIDIGTNGEMFLKKKDGSILAASCAMGPALEGMNISRGMTASEGAVSHLIIDNGLVDLSVIGDVDPVGICGTGIVDAIAEFLKNGIIDRKGAFSKDLEHQGTGITGAVYSHQQRSIFITENVSVSQKDIRNIQLAKGASLSASELLLKESKTEASGIQKVIIAGAFGENLNVDNFKMLGFLPEFPNAEYVFAGNTSLKAAERCCFEKEFRNFIKDVRNRVGFIELSDHPEFNDRFLLSLDF